MGREKESIFEKLLLVYISNVVSMINGGEEAFELKKKLKIYKRKIALIHFKFIEPLV